MQSEEKSSLSRALAKSREEKEGERERNEVREGGRKTKGRWPTDHTWFNNIYDI